MIGSFVKTSSAAPATLPESSAALRSSSTISGPRATLMIRTPSLHLASVSVLMKPWVSGVFGRCSVRKSRGGEHVVGRLGLLGAELAEALGADEGVVGDDAHAEGAGADRDELADAAEAEHAERLALDLGAAELAALPLAGREAGVRLRDVAGEREHQRDRVLGGGDRVGLRRVGDDDALLGGGRDVDVVHADAGAADDLAGCRRGR